MNIPDVTSKGFCGIRYCSMMNPWIDFVVIVPTAIVSNALASIQNGMETYWQGEDEAYGDCIRRNLNDLNQPYMIFYHDSDDLSDEYRLQWEAFVNQIRFVVCEDFMIVN